MYTLSIIMHKREELRKVKVELRSWATRLGEPIDISTNGYFHDWSHISDAVSSSTYGLVELEDGSVHKIDPESILFVEQF